jgi:regulator of replication initiation timing
MAAVAFISFILGALGLLFLSKKGANLLSAIKISDTINKLSREITLKDNRIELLAEQNTLLATENKTLKTQISILKKEHFWRSSARTRKKWRGWNSSCSKIKNH